MITLHVTIEVRNQADLAKVSELLIAHARASRAEPGCLRFELLQSQDPPTSFFIVEDWDSDAAIDAHRIATSFTTIYEPQVLPRVDSRVDVVTPIGQD